MRPDVNAVRRVFQEAGISSEISGEGLGVVCRIEPDVILPALTAFRASGYEMLVDLFASDTGEVLEVTYHIRSFSADTELFVRTSVAYDGETSSVWEVYPAALYAEREAAELLGLTFAGHPNPKRLLTSDEVPGYLLRKSVPVRTHEEVTRDAGDA